MNEVRRLIKAFINSYYGFLYCLKDEPAFRFECVVAILTVPFIFILDFSATQQAVLVLSTFLVLIAEAINTAVEATIDRISLDKHELSKKAKDVGSFVVFLAMVNWLSVWGLHLISTY